LQTFHSFERTKRCWLSEIGTSKINITGHVLNLEKI